MIGLIRRVFELSNLRAQDGHHFLCQALFSGRVRVFTVGAEELDVLALEPSERDRVHVLAAGLPSGGVQGFSDPFSWCVGSSSPAGGPTTISLACGARVSIRWNVVVIAVAMFA